MHQISSLFSQVSIRKSPFDDRQYQALTLPNGLKALIIHEKDLDKSCASLNVHVGSFQDPKEAQGLAHFLEHLLFMGTSTYPKENEFSQFLTEHGGDYNAFTASEFTNYFFNIPSQHLEKTCDIFASFFTCPLFSSGATEREMQAVDSEHRKNVEQDLWRFYQLDKSMSKTEHPYSGFGTGDCSTLNLPGIREKVIEFWNTYYSSHLMTLVVYGSASVEELAKMVVEKFSHIPKREISLDSLYPPKTHLPYDESALRMISIVKPVKDLKTCTFSWQLPSVDAFFSQKPLEYAVHLLGHEGEGSILALLKRQGLATGLTSDSEKYSSFSRLALSIDLTEQGEKEWWKVVEIVFCYLKMLQTNPAESWIIEEWKSISYTNFTFLEKTVPSSYALKLSENMHKFPIEHVLDGDYWIGEVDVNLAQSFVSLLTVENVRIMLATTQESNYSCNLPMLKEPHYGTEYQLQALSSERILQLQKIEVSPELFHPKPNEFIPKDFALNCNQVPYEERQKAPIALSSQGKAGLWYKRNDIFNLPKACVYLLLQYPSLTAGCLANYVKMELMIECLKMQNTSKYYPATLAGLSLNACVTVEGISFKISGFSDKIIQFSNLLLEDYVKFVPEVHIFHAAKESLFRAYKNMENDPPYLLASYWMSNHLQRPSFSYLEKAEAIQMVHFDSLVQFCNTKPPNPSIKALINGNLSEQTAIKAFDQWHEILKISSSSCSPPPPPSPQDPLIKPILLSPEEPLLLFKRVPNSNNAIEIFLQCTPFSNPRIRLLTQLYAQVFKDEFFHQLRTLDQIGYVCALRIRDSYSLIGVRFLVQSAVRSCEWIEARIEEFIRVTHQHLSGAHLKPEEWKNHCQALRDSLLERKKNLLQESDAFWNQIVNGQLAFERAEEEAELLCSSSEKSAVTIEELEKFVREQLLICVNSSFGGDGAGEASEGRRQVRKASIWICGEGNGEFLEEKRIFIQK